MRGKKNKTGTFYKTTAAYGLSVFQRVKAGPFPYHVHHDYLRHCTALALTARTHARTAAVLPVVVIVYSRRRPPLHSTTYRGPSSSARTYVYAFFRSRRVRHTLFHPSPYPRRVRRTLLFLSPSIPTWFFDGPDRRRRSLKS